MPIPAAHIALVRAFNRDYTRRIGVLQESLHDSPYSLTEVRVLYELSNRRGVTAAELASDLELDRGYLSRILQRFTEEKLISQSRCEQDGRRRLLKLTPDGKKRFGGLDRLARRRVSAMLSDLDAPSREAVVQGMQAIQTAFGTEQPCAQAAAGEITLRTHRPGDIGWVVERHGALYSEEYGWNEHFEALVAQIASEFVTRLNPARERCWIAERDGERLGCIFLVAKNRSVAKLRLLLVDPKARGSGLGRTLVAECIKFARTAGYRRIVLWTQQNLSAARHIYKQAGFELTESEAHHSFGHDLVAETWELAL